MATPARHQRGQKWKETKKAEREAEHQGSSSSGQGRGSGSGGYYRSSRYGSSGSGDSWNQRGYWREK